MRCPSCHAPLTYTPGANDAIICRYCRARVEVAAAAAAPAIEVAPGGDYRREIEARFERAERREAPIDGCDTCGAELVRPPEVVSQRCPFCATPAVRVRGTSRVVDPAGLLPFALDEAAARAAVRRWQRRLWFAPRRRFDPSSLVLTPLYAPYWSFDWAVHASYQGRRGRRGSEHVDWTDVHGEVSLELDASMVFASRSIPREIGFDLEPWDVEHVVAPGPEHLAGVAAETYVVGPAAASDVSHRLLERAVTRAVKADIGGDEQEVTSTDLRHDAIGFHLHLMPIWIGVHRAGAAPARVFVNARSGEVIGERPVSRAKVALTAAVPLLLALVGLLVGTVDPLGRGLTGYVAPVSALASVLLLVPGLALTRRHAPHRRQFVLDGASQEAEDLEDWRGSLLQDDPRARGFLLVALAFPGLALGMCWLGFDVAARWMGAGDEGRPLLGLMGTFVAVGWLVAVAFFLRSRGKRRALLGIADGE